MNALRFLLSSALVLTAAAGCSKQASTASNVDCGGGAVTSNFNQFDNGFNGLNFGFGNALNLQTGFRGNNAFLLANGQSIEGLQLCNLQDFQSQFFDNCSNGQTFSGGQFWNLGRLNSLNSLNGLQFGMVGFVNGQQTGGIFQFGVSGNQVGIQALNANGQVSSQIGGQGQIGAQGQIGGQISGQGQLGAQGQLGGIGSQFPGGSQPTTTSTTTTPTLGGSQATALSYARDIQPIIQSSCVGCHNGSKAGVPDLSTIAGLTAAANSGALMRDLNAGTMPKGGAKLPDAQISLIQSWVSAGEPQ